ncbi:MAG: nicotinate phosphoribosyltransferase [Verrucomicrobiota bacterium]
MIEPPLIAHGGLFTDLYELTMAQGYFCAGMAESVACFDYFFRKNPFGGGYVIFAGLEDLLEMLENLRFGPDDLEYLARQHFRRDFLEWLAAFRFRGEIAAPPEGEVVFPEEPVARVRAKIIEAQLIETVVLNLLNFQSLIATKAARVVQAAKGRGVVDFGLRRAQGLGGIHASRAAVVGGVEATSNVYAAFRYAIEPNGTQAHSWVQSFPDELAAFREFARVFPDRCVLLVDTYDTLRSGIPHAIAVARELERAGHRLAGIRLDSGDLAWLSKQARARLDAAGLGYVKIVASNRLDETIVRSLLDQGAPIDSFGVGTSLVTGAGDGSLDGIYKLCELDGSPRMKISDSEAKSTLPGRKEVLRFKDNDGRFTADAIVCAGETRVGEMRHPLLPHQRTPLASLQGGEPLLRIAMRGGQRASEPVSVHQSAAYAKQRLALLPAEFQRFENPHIYRVGISEMLAGLRRTLLDQARARMEQE